MWDDLDDSKLVKKLDLSSLEAGFKKDDASMLGYCLGSVQLIFEDINWQN